MKILFSESSCRDVIDWKRARRLFYISPVKTDDCLFAGAGPFRTDARPSNVFDWADYRSRRIIFPQQKTKSFVGLIPAAGRQQLLMRTIAEISAAAAAA